MCCVDLHGPLKQLRLGVGNILLHGTLVCNRCIVMLSMIVRLCIYTMLANTVVSEARLYGLALQHHTTGLRLVPALLVRGFCQQFDVADMPQSVIVLKFDLLYKEHKVCHYGDRC